jgi:putative membrane protein
MTRARLMAGIAVIGLMAAPALAQNQDQTQNQDQDQTQPQQQQQQMSTGQGQQQQVAQKDIDFAKKAAGDGMAEVKLGELAQQQAESDQVKQFGQRMVDDHGKANEKLKAIAEQKGIDLPQKMPDEAQQTYDQLQKKSGQEFDQAYMDKMVEDHHKAIDLFQQEAKGGQDPELQSFAEQTLPTLQQHLDLAQKDQEQATAAANQGQTGKQAGDQSQASDQQTAAPAAAAGATAATATAATQAPKEPANEQQAATPPSSQPPAATEPAATEKPATPPSTEQQQAATEPAATEKPVTPPAAQQVNAEEVIGSKVVNNKGEEVGKVEDLVIDQDKVQYAVISVGGFLGIGEKHVVVPVDQLKLGEKQVYLTTAQTEDELKKLPEYNKDQYQSQKQG